eukprot:TRINITY_DN8153_c0_g1_i8.p1 TRINITY_DN8153_c0_g1~~TRINITY_DN8153_c0_g1_i8.p1  ORF type:complete len:3703 (+),score=1207.62 TRINITY_DN8153_c0_g1_i8:649-11109(+)
MSVDTKWHSLNTVTPTPVDMPKERWAWSLPARLVTPEHKDDTLKQKRSTLDSHDEVLKMAGEQEDEKAASFTERLQETIVNNIQIDISSIHLRFEDDVTNPSNVYTMGICLESLQVYSTTEDWKRAFVTTVKDIVNKSVVIDKLGIYMDHSKLLTHDLGLAQWKDLMLAGITRRHTYLLTPLSLTTNLAMLSSKGRRHRTADQPAMSAYVNCENLGLGVNRNQIVSLLEVMQFIQKYATLAKYHEDRPRDPVMLRPRKWWAFAKRCVIRSIREQRKATEKTHSGKKKIMNEYITVFKNMQKVPWLPAIEAGSRKEKRYQRILDCYEYHLPLESLMSYRKTAQQQLSAGRALYREKEKAKAAREKEKKKAQSWSSWLVGTKVEESADEVSAHEADILQIDEEARKQLQESIGWEDTEDQEDTPASPHGKEFLKLFFEMNVSTISVALSERLSKEFGSMVFYGLNMNLKQREVGMGTKISLKDFKIEDTTNNTKIVAVRKGEGDLLRINFALAPPDGKADSSLKLSGRGLDVWFDAAWLSRVVSLVQIPPEINLSSLEASTAAAMADLGSGATRNLLLALEERKSIALNINIAGPKIWIPYKERVLELNLGTLQIVSDVDKMRKARVLEGKGDVRDEDYYDRLKLRLDGVFAALCKPGMKETYRYLISDVNFGLLFENCLTPDNTELASSKLSGNIDSIGLFVSPSKLSDLLGAAETVTSWLSNPSGMSGDSDSRWHQKVEALAPIFVNPLKPKTVDEGAWQAYDATYIPQAYKLMLEAPNAPPMIFMIGENTATELSVDDEGSTAELMVILPQARTAEGAHIKLRLRLAAAEAEKLSQHIHTSKWVLRDWKELREVQASKLKQVASDETKPSVTARSHDCLTKVTMQIDLNLNEVCLTLDTNEKVVTTIGMHDLGLKYIARPKDMNVDLMVGRFSICDMLRAKEIPEAEKVFLGLHNRDEVTRAAHFVYCQASKGSPMEIASKGIGTHLDLSCGQLFLDAERNTLSPLLGHLMEYTKIGADEKKTIIFEETAAKAVKVKVKEVRTDAMLIQVHMQEFSTRFRNENLVKFSTSAAKSTLEVMMVPDDRMTVTAALGNFELTHHSDTHELYKQLVACGKEGSMLEVDYTQWYKEASEVVPEYTAECKVRLGQCRIVYLQRTIAQLQRYFDVGYIMKDMTAAEKVTDAVSSAASAAQQMAAAAAEQRSKSLSLMQFDVDVAKPIIVVPYSASSSDHGKFTVGNLVFRTSLKEVQQGCWAEIMDIRLDDTQLVLRDHKMAAIGSEKKIVEDWSISLLGERMVVDPSESLPSMKMNSKIGDIKITMTKAQYEALMSILNTNVLDTWQDDEMPVAETADELAAAGGEVKEEKKEEASKEAKGTSLVFDLEFNKLTLILEVDKEGDTLTTPKALLSSHMTGLRVSHTGMADGGMNTSIWLGHIGVTDSRPTASAYANKLFVFGSEDASDADTKELFVRTVNEKQEKMSVALPAATLTVLPDFIGDTMKFFISEHSSYEAEARYKNLKAVVERSKEGGDMYITETAWYTLDSDLYLGPSHRLIVRGAEGGRVVVDGGSKHRVYLTGGCQCSDAIQPPCDVQNSCIVVANNTTLIFRNTKVFCLLSLEDYVLPGSGKVLIDSETATLISKKHQVKKKPQTQTAAKEWEFEASMSKGFAIHLPEDTASRTSRMLVICVEGKLTMVNETDGPGSSFIRFRTSNFSIFPSTLCGDNSKLQFHNVLGPSVLQFTSQTQVHDDMLETATNIEGQNCGIRVSYKDVKVVLRAWAKLSSALWGDQEVSTSVEKLLIHAPETNEDKVVEVTDQAKRSSKSTMRVNLDKFWFLIVDHQKGYDRELLRVVFDNGDLPYAVAYRMESSVEVGGDSNLSGDVTLNMSIDYHNHHNSHWEPILEPYECNITVSQEPTNSATIPSATSIKMVGADEMNLNVSNDVIKNLIYVSADWQNGLAQIAVTEAEVEHTHAHKYLYVLSNQVGLALDVKGHFTDDTPGEFDTSNTGLKAIRVKGDLFEYNADDEDGVDLSIDFGTCGLRPLKIIMSEVFQQFLVPKTKLEQRERMVYATTKQRSGQLVTTLTSRYIVSNKTSLPLEMRVQGTVIPIPAYNEAEDDGASEIGVPLWALANEHCGIEIRSADEKHKGHHWSATGSKDDSRLSVTCAKPLVGSLTCGYIGQEVRDPMSFYYIRSVRETPCIKQGAELRVIEIKAPIKLENLLPVPIEVVLAHGDNMKDIRAKVTLQAGESQEVFSVSDSTVYATYQVVTPESGQQFNISNPVLIHGDTLKTNSESACVRVQDEVTKRVCHLVLSNNCENTTTAVREVSIYAPYWLVNLTQHEVLFVKDKDGRPLSLGLAKAPNDQSAPPPLLFSGNGDDAFGGKISVGITPDKMSSAFTYDTVGVSGEARCKYDGYEVRLGVAIELAPGKFMRTKIVKLSQRWVFKNNSSAPLVVKRALLKKDDAMVLLEGEMSGNIVFPESYKNGEDEEMVLSILGDESWGESKQFKFSELGTQYITLLHRTMGLKTFDCRVVQLGSINYVIFSNSTSPPLRVVNNTFHSFTIGDKKEGQPEINVVPFSINPYYPEKTKGKNVPWVRVHSPDILDTSIELALGPQEQKAHGTDIIAHIELGHDSMLLVLEHETMRAEDTTDLQIPSFKIDFQSTITFSLIKGVGMERHEIAFVYLGGVSFYYGQKADSLDMSVSVEIFQIDNQMHNAIFPVLLTSISSNDKMKTAKQKAEETRSSPSHADPEGDDKVREALFFSVLDYSTRIGGMTTMSHCSLLLQELHMSVDDTFLMEFLGYLGNVFVTEAVSSEEIVQALKWQPEYKEELHGASMSGKFYAAELILNPIKLVITFQAEQKMKSGKAEDMWHSAISTLTMAVTNIEEGVLKLDALIISPASGSTADITAAITQHYITSGIKAAYRLVGALDFLGNPVGLISNIGDGISDLFYEPVYGIKQSPGKFAVGIGRGLGSVGRHTAHGLLGSVGGITTSISKGVAQLSMDEEYIKERRKRQRQKAVTVTQGLEQGGMALGRGVFDGITGLVMKPIEGVRNHEGNKVVGLSLGIGRGIIGVPVKVVGGVLDAVGKAAEGAKGQVSGAETVLRRRPPRAMIGGVIQDYCRLHACAHDMIRSLGLTDVTGLLVPYTIPGKEGKKMNYTAFTNHHVVLFDVENDGKRWTCTMVVDYKKITEVMVTDSTLVVLKVAGSKSVEIRMNKSKRYVYQVIELIGKVLPNVPLHQWVFPALSSSSTGYIETWENERRYMSGYTKTLLPTDRPLWSDADGKEERLKSDMRHLPHNCVWLSDWEVVKSKTTDGEGWMYAQDFPFTWADADSSDASVRRRRWVRKFGLYEDEQVRLSVMSDMRDETLEKYNETAAETEQAEIRTFETYENQRSYPFIGFSSKVLPTDRPAWSSRNGKERLQKEGIYVPGGFRWLGDWQIDKGSKTDPDGWEYAVDFPFEWSSSKAAKHLVRRRRWIRRAVRTNEF